VTAWVGPGREVPYSTRDRKMLSFVEYRGKLRGDWSNLLLTSNVTIRVCPILS